jgi:hypothetical protein
MGFGDRLENIHFEVPGLALLRNKANDLGSLILFGISLKRAKFFVSISSF